MSGQAYYFAWGDIVTAERKRMCLFVGANFLIGTVIGIVLFYAHIRANAGGILGGYLYEKNLQLADLFRAWWVNIMWMISVLLGHNVLCAAPVHIIVCLRGSVNSFSALFLLESFGVKEMVATILPQCLSILPMLIFFSVFCVEKRQSDRKKGIDSLVITRKETAAIFFVSLFSALLEAALFWVLVEILL